MAIHVHQTDVGRRQAVTMRILFHLSGLVLFTCLFLVGKLMYQRRQRCAEALAYVPVSNERLSKFFRYGGETIEVVAFVFGFLEAVAVLILTSGTLIELWMTLSLAD